MTTESFNPTTAWLEFMKCVSERNIHIPPFEIELMMGISTLDTDDDDWWD